MLRGWGQHKPRMMAMGWTLTTAHECYTQPNTTANTAKSFYASFCPSTTGFENSKAYSAYGSTSRSLASTTPPSANPTTINSGISGSSRYQRWGMRSNNNCRKGSSVRTSTNKPIYGTVCLFVLRGVLTYENTHAYTHGYHVEGVGPSNIPVYCHTTGVIKVVDCASASGPRAPCITANGCAICSLTIRGRVHGSGSANHDTSCKGMTCSATRMSTWKMARKDGAMAVHAVEMAWVAVCHG